MLPERISSYGDHVDFVILIIFIIAAASTLFAFAFIGYSLIRFNHTRNPKPTRTTPKYVSGLVYISVLMFVFDIFIAIFSFRGWHEIMGQKREELIEKYKDYISIKVTGRQFYWNFTYAGEDRKLGTNDDFTTSDYFVVPEGKLVLLTLSSGDVIHSFFCPNMRFKYDCVPGREIESWWICEKRGEFEILCAELCGPEHYRMKAKLRVVTDKEFENWMKSKTGGN